MNTLKYSPSNQHISYFIMQFRVRKNNSGSLHKQMIVQTTRGNMHPFRLSETVLLLCIRESCTISIHI